MRPGKAFAAIIPIAALLATATPAQAEDGPSNALSGRKVELRPYIAAAQVLTSELSPGSDTVTYTRLAAGVDGTINGRNNQAAISVRYERQIGWGERADADLLSGLARGSVAIIPQALSFEAGALATRTRIENNGGATLAPLDGGSNTSKAYSVYAGPSLATHAGDVALSAAYRFGYSRVTQPDAVVATPTGADKVDVFDDSTTHVAGVHAGTKPGDVLPVGLGIGANMYREDISNFDQRVDQKNVRADATLPVSRTVALVGGVGYEKIKVTHRDVQRDADGNVLFDSQGDYLLDKSSPRLIAYDVSGLIWDAGFIWMPSPRTALEAHVGHRYGGMTYFGSFGWQPSARSSVNVSVYDSIGGLGARMTTALVDLPTDFESTRNPLSGDIGNCVASQKKGSCLGSVLGSVRSSVFRARGISASYALNMGRISTGIGAGYERRKFKAARGSILASADGQADENMWIAAFLNAQLSEKSSVSTNVYANWFDSNFFGAGSATAMGATVAYDRLITRRLSATAAVGIDGVNRNDLPDYWEASALLGMRYNF